VVLSSDRTRETQRAYRARGCSYCSRGRSEDFVARNDRSRRSPRASGAELRSWNGSAVRSHEEFAAHATMEDGTLSVPSAWRQSSPASKAPLRCVTVPLSAPSGNTRRTPRSFYDPSYIERIEDHSVSGRRTPRPGHCRRPCFVLTQPCGCGRRPGPQSQAPPQRRRRQRLSAVRPPGHHALGRERWASACST